jgi:hypothetical protein
VSLTSFTTGGSDIDVVDADISSSASNEGLHRLKKYD